jgi:hypothetical protein
VRASALLGCAGWLASWANEPASACSFLLFLFLLKAANFGNSYKIAKKS